MKIELSQKTEKPQKREASNATCFLEPFRSYLFFFFFVFPRELSIPLPRKKRKRKTCIGNRFFPERGPKSVTCFVLGIPHIPLNGLSPSLAPSREKPGQTLRMCLKRCIARKQRRGRGTCLFALRCRFVRFFFLSGRHDTVISLELRRECRIHYPAVQMEKMEH